MRSFLISLGSLFILNCFVPVLVFGQESDSDVEYYPAAILIPEDHDEEEIKETLYRQGYLVSGDHLLSEELDGKEDRKVFKPVSRIGVGIYYNGLGVGIEGGFENKYGEIGALAESSILLIPEAPKLGLYLSIKPWADINALKRVSIRGKVYRMFPLGGWLSTEQDGPIYAWETGLSFRLGDLDEGGPGEDFTVMAGYFFGEPPKGSAWTKNKKGGGLIPLSIVYSIPLNP